MTDKRIESFVPLGLNTTVPKFYGGGTSYIKDNGEFTEELLRGAGKFQAGLKHIASLLFLNSVQMKVINSWVPKYRFSEDYTKLTYLDYQGCSVFVEKNLLDGRLYYKRTVPSEPYNVSMYNTGYSNLELIITDEMPRCHMLMTPDIRALDSFVHIVEVGC